MGTQRFDPERQIKSQQIRTPGLAKLHRSFLIRMLVVERIRCLMDDVPFNDNPHMLVAKFLPIPTHYKDEEQKDRYIKSEVLEVMAAFKRFEETPAYQEDLKALVPYKGHIWHLISSSDSGVLITVTV